MLLASALNPALWLIVVLLGIAFGFARPAAGAAAAALIIQVTVTLWLAMRFLRRRRLFMRAQQGGAPAGGASAQPGTLETVGTTRAHHIQESAALADLPPTTLAAFGTETRAGWVREHLAGTATGWRHDYDSLLAALRTEPITIDGERVLRETDLVALGLLSGVVSSQLIADNDASDASVIATHVSRRPGLQALPPVVRWRLAECLLREGDLDGARALLDAKQTRTLTDELLACDLLNPYQPDGGDPRMWMQALNSVYRRVGLDTLAVSDGPGSPLDRVHGTEPSSTIDGPLISVIMTSFCPELETLLCAVESVVAQSWRNWELILVDDGSPESFEVVLDEAAKLDSRITVVRAATNSGTYACRNEALARARGEFVTFHDSDDWAHPRRLEIQARHLMAHQNLFANVSHGTRVTSTLRFAQPRGAALRLCESTLMIRRQVVLDTVGYFDPVRKGADSGYRRRIEAAMKQPTPLVAVGAPLMLIRFDTGSLSGTDIRSGWIHPARTAYTNAVDAWIDSGQTKLDHPLHERPYPAPHHILGTPVHYPPLDVLYVLDPFVDRARKPSNHMKMQDHEIHAAIDSGLTVGVTYARALYERPQDRRVRPSIQRLINSGLLVEALDRGMVHAKLAVVLDAAVLMGVGAGEPRISADRAMVLKATPGLSAPGARMTPYYIGLGLKALTGRDGVDRVALTDVREARAVL